MPPKTTSHINILESVTFCKYHIQEVGVESTSVYWIPVWRVLEPHFGQKLISPYFIKQLPRHKSDVKDAQWIVKCMLKELVRASFVPPERS